jgi:5-methylcytosine-specific restriction endonuclease McrA
MSDQTILSDITDINTNSSIDIEDKIIEIKSNLITELNKLNSDNLKDKCKELGINGISKLKKQELVQSLEEEFKKLIVSLKEKKSNDLKNICKQYGIKGFATAKKEIILYQILLYTSSKMIFKCDMKEVIDIKELSLIEQLEKQKMEIEQKMNEEIKKQEEEKRIKDEELGRIKEEEKRIKDEEEKIIIENEKKDIKKKKQSIPKNVRIIIWNHYIGEDIIKHKCMCCKKVTISNTNFEVGHVLSEKNNGTHEINNLRPICFSCNHSMGTENMIDFVVKFGLYIG